MTSFEEKVNQRLVDTGLSMPELAELTDMPEAELHALCRQGDPRLSQMTQLAEALRIDPLYFLPPITQGGAFNQAGTNNTLKIKIGKAAAYELAGQLNGCQRALDLATQLVASKNETIALLRDGLNRPN